jgi:hypothetical protein
MLLFEYYKVVGLKAGEVNSKKAYIRRGETVHCILSITHTSLTTNPSSLRYQLQKSDDFGFSYKRGRILPNWKGL